MGQVFTGLDIRRLAREGGARYLLLAADDRITPEAMDIARSLGMQVHRQGDPLADRSEPPPVNTHPLDERPIAHINAESIRLESFAADVGHPEMNIRLKDVISTAHGSPMAAGFMTWERGSFPWVLNYDEIDYVIEGQLEIRKGRQVVLGSPGDVIHIPKGSNIFFGSPSFARVFYVTFPADWESR